MSGNASGKRRYDASGRRSRARLTRERIIEAAAVLFLERGYAGATVPMIAERAGVAVETVYRSATGKAGLLAAAVQSAVAGGVARATVPVDERPGIRRVIDEPDSRRQLEAYAATQSGVWSRVGPLLRVLDEAAPGDDELAALQRDLGAQRYAGLRRFADALADQGALRADVTVEAAADILWTLCAQANYEALVSARGWAPTTYRQWLSATLAAALLRDSDRDAGAR